MNLQVTPYVLGHMISVSEKYIATLLGHDGSEKWCFGMLSKNSKMEEIAELIFTGGKPDSNPKNLL